MNVLRFICLFTLLLSSCAKQGVVSSPFSSVVVDFTQEQDYYLFEKDVYLFNLKKVAEQFNQKTPPNQIQFIENNAVPEYSFQELYYENNERYYTIGIKRAEAPSRALRLSSSQMNLFSFKGLKNIEQLFIQTKDGIYEVKTISGGVAKSSHYQPYFNQKYGYQPYIDLKQIKENNVAYFKGELFYELPDAHFKRATGFQRYGCKTALHYNNDFNSFFFIPKIGILKSYSFQDRKYINTRKINHKNIPQFFEKLCGEN